MFKTLTCLPYSNADKNVAPYPFEEDLMPFWGDHLEVSKVDHIVVVRGCREDASIFDEDGGVED